MEKGVKWPEKRVTDRDRCVCESERESTKIRKRNTGEERVIRRTVTKAIRRRPKAE